MKVYVNVLNLEVKFIILLQMFRVGTEFKEDYAEFLWKYSSMSRLTYKLFVFVAH